MSFEALIEKVKQAETALEAQERQAAADWRQLKASWRQAWSPGRIVIVGLLSGFLTGRAEPLKRAGGGVLNLITALAGLFAGGSAQAAAGEAEHAAHNAQQTAAAVSPEAALAASTQHAAAQHATHAPTAILESTDL